MNVLSFSPESLSAAAAGVCNGTRLLSYFTRFRAHAVLLPVRHFVSRACLREKHQAQTSGAVARTGGHCMCVSVHCVLLPIVSVIYNCSFPPFHPSIAISTHYRVRLIRSGGNIWCPLVTSSYRRCILHSSFFSRASLSSISAFIRCFSSSDRSRISSSDPIIITTG